MTICRVKITLTWQSSRTSDALSPDAGRRGAAAADAGLHRLRELGRLDGLRDEPHPEGSAQRLPQAHVRGTLLLRVSAIV